ncbi:MAG: type II secretion system F family protein [Candidatus Micrarchaeia archaeon]
MVGAIEIKRIPMMVLPLSTCSTIGSRYRGIGLKISSFYPSIKYDLRSIGVTYAPENYCAVAFFSALIWGLIIGFFLALVLSRVSFIQPMLRVFLLLLLALMTTAFFLLLHLFYPRMIAKNVAERIDRELIFAMRDLLIQLSSGVPLFNAIENVANSNYGYVSREFTIIATHVKGGASLLDEVEAMAVRTQSEYLKKTAWQMATAIRSGSNVTSTIKGVVKMLVDYQFTLTKSFNAELNFIVLIYLMVSSVLPTIGTTVLVIFSVFGMLGVTPEVFMILVGISFFGQAAVIGYVKLKRPNLFE